jgi:hypothetical protein
LTFLLRYLFATTPMILLFLTSLAQSHCSAPISY